MRSCETLLAIWLALACTFAAAAQEAVSYPAPDAAVAAAPGLTYADLLRLVVTDLQVEDAGFTGTGLMDLRHIDDGFGETAVPSVIEAYRIAAFPVGEPESRRLALFFDLGMAAEGAEGFAVLALVDVSAAPKLLDAANVAFDRFTSPLAPHRLALGGGDLLLTISTHHNSSQGYATVPLILARDGRLQLVDSVSTLDDHVCAHDRVQRVEVTVGDDTPMADIVATVTESTTPTGAECGDDTVPGPPQRVISVTYRWNADLHSYLPDSDAFEVLARENEQRF